MYENVENALKERGMSKMKLAKEMGVNPPDLYNAFNGYKPMFPKYRKLISEILGIPQEILFGGDVND